jgi:hypothetical protein
MIEVDEPAGDTLRELNFESLSRVSIIVRIQEGSQAGLRKQRCVCEI